ncbi:hypothetical protein BHE74_00049919 [Ensete ventricosum]|nr:hypothetical protein BHE74_00049919 [Ensete ventricosum]
MRTHLPTLQDSIGAYSIREKGLLKTPNLMKTRFKERDCGRYYYFHRNYSHDTEITFESESEYPDHDNALVITACIANARVKRIMIDTGNSIDILYFDTFLKLGMTNRDLTL